LYSDQDLVDQLIENGRVQRQKFSWDVAAERIYALLKERASCNKRISF
jgi:hypothetical protein